MVPLRAAARQSKVRIRAPSADHEVDSLWPFFQTIHKTLNRPQDPSTKINPSCSSVSTVIFIAAQWQIISDKLAPLVIIMQIQTMPSRARPSPIERYSLLSCSVYCYSMLMCCAVRMLRLSDYIILSAKAWPFFFSFFFLHQAIIYIL